MTVSSHVSRYSPLQQACSKYQAGDCYKGPSEGNLTWLTGQDVTLSYQWNTSAKARSVSPTFAHRDVLIKHDAWNIRECVWKFTFPGEALAHPPRRTPMLKGTQRCIQRGPCLWQDTERPKTRTTNSKASTLSNNY